MSESLMLLWTFCFVPDYMNPGWLTDILYSLPSIWPFQPSKNCRGPDIAQSVDCLERHPGVVLLRVRVERRFGQVPVVY